MFFQKSTKLQYRLTFPLSLLIALGSLIHACAQDAPPPVQLDLFVSPGCTECEHVKADVMPEVEERFAEQYDLRTHDITVSANVPLLIAYQERCGNHQNGKVSIVVDHHIFFSGYESIAENLMGCIDKALIERQYPGWSLPAPPELEGAQADEIVKKHAGAMTFSVVALGGLIDGINPCAISTLIFFISVLVIAKVDKRIRLLVGVSFIFASFVVYSALGLGFIYALRQAPNFDHIRRIIGVTIGVCMLPLAFLSFRDAFRFRKSERPADVTLQIPNKIKKHIHAFMKSRLGVGGPIIGGLVTGAGVTVLESVCTGQSYVPVLMYMLKQDVSNLSAWTLLIVYNLLFVLPLAIVFICFHHGLEVTAMISWSKRNLVLAKILLGIFFTLMAILLIFH